MFLPVKYNSIYNIMKRYIERSWNSNEIAVRKWWRIMKNSKKPVRGEIFLMATALIWGSSFVAQKASMDYIGPFTFIALRFILGALFLVPVVILMDRIKQKNTDLSTELMDSTTKVVFITKPTLLGGAACGFALFLGASFQQTGIVYTASGKAGFITALYIVLVPLLGLLLHKKVRSLIWVGVAFATAGLYFLCIKEGFTIEKGDLIVLLGTIFWAIHILIIDHYAPTADCLKMSTIQFFVAGLLSGIAMFLTETPGITAILDSAWPILYTAVVVTGVAYTLQILGQRNTDPAIASIIMSLESVFAVISGMLLLHEVMSTKEIIGCVLMFIAVIITQLPQKDNALQAVIEQ
jgi:drug/metabolite transporter (DMT)-like permease